MRICIDPGHTFGSNPSPADPTYSEGTRMFALARFLRRALERYGAEIVCTRGRVTDDPSDYERGRMGRGCALLLSLHSNAVASGRNDNVDYVSVLYPVNHRGEQLAQALSEVVADVMGTRQLPQFLVRRNAARDAELDPVMRFAAQMGTLALRVEHSFHTQPRIAAWLRSDENLRRLAEAEAALIAEYFGLEAPEERYELLKDVRCPAYRATLEKLARRGLLDGWCGEGESLRLDLGEDSLRLLTLLDRAGVFDLVR